MTKSTIITIYFVTSLIILLIWSINMIARGEFNIHPLLVLPRFVVSLLFGPILLISFIIIHIIFICILNEIKRDEYRNAFKKINKIHEIYEKEGPNYEIPINGEFSDIDTVFINIRRFTIYKNICDIVAICHHGIFLFFTNIYI